MNFINLLNGLLFVRAATGLTISTTNSSLTLLFQNNLNVTDDFSHTAAILLDPLPVRHASSACQAIGERLLTKDAVGHNSADFVSHLAYLSYKKASLNRYLLAGGITVSLTRDSTLSFEGYDFTSDVPVLCTRTSKLEPWSTDPIPASAQVTVIANEKNIYTGYRGVRAFRFLGIPYADPYRRWEHTNVFSATGLVVNALAYGPPCPRPGAIKASEQCLTLNIQTPYLPYNATSDAKLRPVLVWIHGGGYENGDSSDGETAGDNLASREDIVVVTINYRLATFGFLAVPGVLNGNYGIGDMITALRWVRQNIAYFGGNPDDITIAGESAGAAAVRVLTGSSLANRLFSKAIIMSSPGGGDAFNRTDFAYPYSHYLTLEQSFARAGQNIFNKAGCNQKDVNAQLDCLRQKDTKTVAEMWDIDAKYVVQDGVIVTTPRLDVNAPTMKTLKIPVMIGGERNDGASFARYPVHDTATLLEGLEYSLNVSAAQAQRIIDSKLFPYYDTKNKTNDIFNVTQRVATDEQFRCEAQATLYAGVKSGAFARAYAFEVDRTWLGYDANSVMNVTAPGRSTPYYKLHSGGLPHIFGMPPIPVRSDEELKSLRYSVASFAAFIRTGSPTPDAAYLRARGYVDVLQAVLKAGPWKSAGEDGPVQLVGQWPPASSGFVDVEQCRFLGYPLDEYVPK